MMVTNRLSSAVVTPGDEEGEHDRQPQARFRAIPKGYHDLSDAEQLVICEQIAQALIEQLGVPDRLPSETPN